MTKRRRALRHDQATVRKSREGCNGVFDLRRSRTLIGLTSMPNDGATAWIAANWAVPAVKVGSRRTATRVTPGATSLSNCSHFPLRPYSKLVNPVALPPGRAKLST